MNCKQGELAIVVRSCAGNHGVIVECVSLTHGIVRYMPDGTRREGPCWFIGRGVRGWDGRVTQYIADENLRPLRDGDGEDEMLRIAGLPQPVATA